MSLAAPLFDQLPSPARRTAYRAQHAALRYPLLAAHGLLRRLARRRGRPRPGTERALRREYERLLERDLRNAEEGLYPASLLFQLPLRDYALALPRFLIDVPNVLERFRRRHHADVPDVDPERFPAYFRRNFHWQTDGYLSEHSAKLYDLSVELLFVGCADVMRRQVIPPITRFARANPKRCLRILDVGCGTGRTLSQLAAALPDQRYFGVDLSPHYLGVARRQLAKVPELTLVAENAEALPFRDGYFDVVTSVFVFHELPRRQRRAVASELARVLRPGGLLVVEDSAQLREARDLAAFLEAFAASMHEPYYRGYVRDPLEDLLAEAGLEPGETSRAWLSKVVTATRSA